MDELIVREKEDVIGSQERFFKRKSALAGSIIAGIFAVPILICLIANLAGGHGLNWFFIVLAAMFIPMSLFVVPLMAPKNRMFLTMISFTGSILFLLAVCSIYSGGHWFFIAAPSVLFGLTVCFSPFIACRRPVNAYLKNCKGLAVMAADTLTFFLMLTCIGLYDFSIRYFVTAFSVSIPLVLMVWLTFLIIRYLPANGFIKAGTCIALNSTFGYFGSLAFAEIMVRTAVEEVVIYSETSILTLIGGIGLGAVFVAIGMFVKKGGKKS